MANTTISPNMNLPVPTVGQDPGPDWANNIVACLNIIDSHPHTTNGGVPITPGAININTDLTFANNSATNLTTLRFTPQSAPITGGANLGALYEQGVDLYYIDGAGNQVRITQGGSVTGATGTITGLPSGTASASYSAGTFTFQQATNTPATLNVGSVVIGQEVVSGKNVTIAANGAQAANYNLTLPLALPATPSLITSDASGNLGFTPNGGNVRASEGGGTVTLTNSDNRIQTFNLSANEVVKLPTTAVTKGDIWEMINPNAFRLTIEASDTSVIVKSFGSDVRLVALVNTPVASTDWAIISHTVLFGASWTNYTPTYSTGTGITTTYVSKWMRSGIDEIKIYFQLRFSGTNSGGSGSFLMYAPTYFTYASGDYPDGSTGMFGTISYTQSGSFYFGGATPSFMAGNNSFVFASGYNITDSTGSRIRFFNWNDFNANDRLGGEYTFKATELATS